jgi:AcrR family transcriptional regulator
MSESGRVYTGRSAAERDADRRERLLTAGHELFGRDGFAATSIERLCTTANVSTRHFYTLFPNKEECFLAVYDLIAGASLEQAGEALARTSEAPIQERVSQAFQAYVRPLLLDAKAGRIVFVETVVVGVGSEKHRSTIREALVSTIESTGSAAVARGEIADRNFRIAALALIGAAGAIVYDWARSPSACSMAELEQELEAIAVKLLTE